MNTKKLTHPGNLLLAGFGLMILLMSLLVYGSIRQDIPLVSRNYYEQELRYQEQIEARSNADNYAGAFTAEVTGDYLVLTLPHELAKTIASGEAYFYCASRERMDRHFPLTADSSGNYIYLHSELPGKGYTLKVSFVSAGKNYYKTFTLPW